jgi:hypothetical protein
MSKSCMVAALVLSTFMATLALAAVPQTITYQCRKLRQLRPEMQFGKCDDIMCQQPLSAGLQ